jgi:hypothetical protein
MDVRFILLLGRHNISKKKWIVENFPEKAVKKNMMLNIGEGFIRGMFQFQLVEV